MLRNNNSPVPHVVKEKACMPRANLAYSERYRKRIHICFLAITYNNYIGSYIYTHVWRGVGQA